MGTINVSQKGGTRSAPRLSLSPSMASGSRLLPSAKKWPGRRTARPLQPETVDCVRNWNAAKQAARHVGFRRRRKANGPAVCYRGTAKPRPTVKGGSPARQRQRQGIRRAMGRREGRGRRPVSPCLNAKGQEATVSESDHWGDWEVVPPKAGTAELAVGREKETPAGGFSSASDWDIQTEVQARGRSATKISILRYMFLKKYI